ncbi:MAG TPA: exosortase H [Acidobacteriota bacterium]|nr:exosortase H [Acidobacteriota bacterium]
MKSSWTERLKQPAVRFVAGFIAIVIVFNLFLAIAWVDENLIHPYTQFITAVSANILVAGGYDDLDWQGTIIRTGRFAVDIRRGCDGVVATILLIAACLAFPASWKQRLIGTGLGFLLIFLLNQVRIVVLFVLGDQGAMNLFEFVHTYVAQFAVIALTMVFWVYWAGRQKPVYS